jgi:hypothetical protein
MAPRTRFGDHSVRSGDVARDSAEAGDVERWPVVDAQVHLGSRSVGATGPAATENYADDPAVGGQSAGEINELVLSDHSCSMPLGRARDSPNAVAAACR